MIVVCRTHECDLDALIQRSCLQINDSSTEIDSPWEPSQWLSPSRPAFKVTLCCSRGQFSTARPGEVSGMKYSWLPWSHYGPGIPRVFMAWICDHPTINYPGSLAQVGKSAVKSRAIAFWIPHSSSMPLGSALGLTQQGFWVSGTLWRMGCSHPLDTFGDLTPRWLLNIFPI